MQKAVRLYRWNCTLSQALLWPLHMLEVTNRNAVSEALAHKYGARWLYHPTFRSVLDADLRRNIDAATDRQCFERGTLTPLMDQVIADLTMGFWTSLLAKQYEVPFGWATRIRIAFPNLPATAGRSNIAIAMSELRDLRNRVAHHEPILHLKLTEKYNKILNLLNWRSPNILWLVQQSCIVMWALKQEPKI